MVDAWVLSSPDAGRKPKFARQAYSFTPLAPDEVLAEPLFGSWEGNMGHALTGSPMDLCARRGEDVIVLGNSGVVRVLKSGTAVGDLREGDLCRVYCAGELDPAGYPITIMGYDCPGTMGVLARQAKFKRRQLALLPSGGDISLASWAAFSLRYVSAYSNWLLAARAWRIQMGHAYPAGCDVFAWGGGVALAELELAAAEGCRATLITSKDKYRRHALARGIGVIMRGGAADPGAADTLGQIMDRTEGRGAAIFIDNIGADFRVTVRALARQGVIATCGWRDGMTFPLVRASECINRHVHVFTHYAHAREAEDAVALARSIAWYPTITSPVWAWEEIGDLADAYARGEIEDYFPVFAVNDA
ncbi:hypothetical protein [Azospirillum sp. B510]|uniref:hypothetical protein n=1 Tax=Azospirillum sp. (strain B510) TaxID=137722 RepID=UPI0005A9BE95|nr:hypothetical protein [Azospirillum sp. B510]